MAKNKNDQPEKIELLTREEILGADDVGSELVEVPEWGGTVKIKGFTGAERDQYQVMILKSPGKSAEVNLENATAKLLSMCIVDKFGKPLFGKVDIIALGRKSGVALNRCYSVAQRLCGLTTEDIQELIENLSEGQSGSSISG